MGLVLPGWRLPACAYMGDYAKCRSFGKIYCLVALISNFLCRIAHYLKVFL